MNENFYPNYKIIPSVIKEAKWIKATTFLVYHGTNQSFKSFDIKYLGTTSGTTTSNMAGFFFTDNKQVAQSFGKNILTAKITLNNPKTINANGKDYSQFKHQLNSIVEKSKTKYDGIIIKNYVDAGIGTDQPISSTQFIVFNPKQIHLV